MVSAVPMMPMAIKMVTLTARVAPNPTKLRVGYGGSSGFGEFDGRSTVFGLLLDHALEMVKTAWNLVRLMQASRNDQILGVVVVCLLGRKAIGERRKVSGMTRTIGRGHDDLE